MQKRTYEKRLWVHTEVVTSQGVFADLGLRFSMPDGGSGAENAKYGCKTMAPHLSNHAVFDFGLGGFGFEGQTRENEKNQIRK